MRELETGMPETTFAFFPEIGYTALADHKLA